VSSTTCLRPLTPPDSASGPIPDARDAVLDRACRAATWPRATQARYRMCSLVSALGSPGLRRGSSRAESGRWSSAQRGRPRHGSGRSESRRALLLAICETGDALPVEARLRRLAGIQARSRVAALVQSGNGLAPRSRPASVSLSTSGSASAPRLLLLRSAYLAICGAHPLRAASRARRLLPARAVAVIVAISSLLRTRCEHLTHSQRAPPSRDKRSEGLPASHESDRPGSSPGPSVETKIARRMCCLPSGDDTFAAAADRSGLTSCAPATRRGTSWVYEV
jgi:hypothetical protein